MPSVTVEDFKVGKDSRRAKTVADANRLLQLQNAYITKGKVPRSRPGTSIIARLETGTKGLVAANGKLNTFYGSGSITHANTDFIANSLSLGNPLEVLSATVGADVDDLTSGGTYTGDLELDFVITIDGTASPDTFKWSKGGGSETTGVAITGGAQTLSDGVTVTFGATTGHAVGDVWTILCKNLIHHSEGLIITSVFSQWPTNQSAAFDGLITVKAEALIDHAHIGKDWGAGISKTITRFKVTGETHATTGGIGATGDPSITITLQGSNDGVIFTDLGSTTFTDASGIVVDKTSGLTATPYRFHRLYIDAELTGTGSVQVMEVEFYEQSVADAVYSKAEMLDDLTVGSSFTDSSDNNFYVEIDSTGAADTFKWRKGSGSYTTGVTITGSAQSLSDGAEITFTAVSGHRIGDVWNIKARASASFAISRIHYGQTFLGLIYASIEFLNGEVKHFYAGARINDLNCPNSKGVARTESKIFAIDGDTVRFSKTNDPTDWTEAADAGFLATGIQEGGSDEATALGVFQKNLVVFSSDGAQLWDVDPDPALMVFSRFMPGARTRYPGSILPFGGDLVFLSDAGFRTISQSILGDSNLEETDVGSPIDDEIIAILDPLTINPVSGRYNTAGQFLCSVGGVLYAYTYSKSLKISAWSDYTFPFAMIDAIAELDGSLYIRSGDIVYKLDHDLYLDAVETGLVITAFADNGAGGTTVTSASHNRADADIATISGTTSYNGTEAISNVTANTFDIDMPFVADDATGTFTVGTSFKSTIQLPYLHAKKPGIDKYWNGFDAAIQGMAQVSFAFDPNDEDFVTQTFDVSGDTRPSEMLSPEVSSVSLSPIFEHEADELFQLDSFTLWYEDGGNTA